MAKRGYKLQEFVAHAGNVNCLSFGKKNCRVFITGGDDQKVNLWSVGKPTSLMSLCGHTSPVESAAFDSAEVLVVAGSSSGAIKLWDLEETKMVRTLTGHRSYCTAVEFHPFGEFFASGSMDTNLKIWDIRKKGCIHTYKGHTRGISTIRFTPDGRWVVSGGFDNVVKVWDLTAGKLLHDFKFHEGHIRTIEFHPLEFLLATGSADKTVKFWDLETFEMIGSARREAAGVRSIAFHPDGRTLFCGLDDSLKVYSWEPVVCHDSVDMGWSTLGDLCIQDGKLLGGAYYENSVAVWIADVSLMEPYGTRLAPEQHGHSELKHESEGSPLEKEESHVKSKSNLKSTELDSESKDIKTIYVDRVNSVSSKTTDPVEVPKVVQPSDSSQISTIGVQKRNPRSSSPPSDSSQTSTIGVQKRNPRSSSPPSDSSQISTIGVQKRNPRSSSPPSDSSQISTIGVQKRNPRSSSPPSDSKEISSIRIQKHSSPATLPPSESKEISTIGKRGPAVSLQAKVNVPSVNRSIIMPSIVPRDGPGKDSIGSRRESIALAKASSGMNSKPPHTRRQSSSRLDMERMSVSLESLPPDNVKKPVVSRKDPSLRNRLFADANAKDSSEEKQSNIDTVVEKPDRTSLPATTSSAQALDSSKGANSVKVVNGVAVVHGRTRSLVERFEGKEKIDVGDNCTSDKAHGVVFEPAETPSPQVVDQKIDVRMEPTLDDNNVLENLMQSHDVLLSTFRSRLTKLQVVRHFWERNDVKGAINAVKRLPDLSVQADVVGVLIERMEVITLDLFSSLLPVLLGLLESKAERHASLSLEVLLKLVAVFGTVVRTTVSAPRSVGVDLHAEERLECCRQCFAHLQNVQNILPELVKRGGGLARYAQQLNMVLQQT
ncbi:katanin p80 WD40 repeat-containing subunit B1 homolog KTN80.4 isoform X2 [Salvia miltiorrhiza]|uniref:katanin p80 WD40 repeat-containing subunit B1 homolog KTN80.4 isoform X2 n=1 Tax=Salvia miltiorrhiza TaxID=226208 RepID=UPI0025ABBF5B|nr:katanin p80 WD40 repeat-containing subunit B1 homolog KTN80.4 isoform X2 [Salvia miltiorrhiza]